MHISHRYSIAAAEIQTLTRSSRIFLKLENLQPSGSFKSRGIGNYLLRRIEESEASGKRPHFYASSGGNAGIACVVAARSLGYEASVVVPTTTSPALVTRLREEGARTVYQHGQ
ncbi:pyridoxal-phosphate dependent enzyme, partial [Candidatus Bathyarchaeota archaeon]|nr:pyridoxal-phosphate dependent enzyme [Candidatus Bathyarchaeota archaeon]